MGGKHPHGALWGVSSGAHPPLLTGRLGAGVGPWGKGRSLFSKKAGGSPEAGSHQTLMVVRSGQVPPRVLIGSCCVDQTFVLDARI